MFKVIIVLSVLFIQGCTKLVGGYSRPDTLNPINTATSYKLYRVNDESLCNAYNYNGAWKGAYLNRLVKEIKDRNIKCKKKKNQKVTKPIIENIGKAEILVGAKANLGYGNGNACIVLKSINTNIDGNLEWNFFNYNVGETWIYPVCESAQVTYAKSLPNNKILGTKNLSKDGTFYKKFKLITSIEAQTIILNTINNMKEGVDARFDMGIKVAELIKMAQSQSWKKSYDENQLRKEKTLPSIPKKATPKVADKYSGTGFFISNLGHIITNKHVINKCSKITVGSSNNRQLLVKIIETDSKNDLALLRLNNIKKAPINTQSLIKELSINIVPLASGGLMRKNDVRGGEDVFVAGFPYGEIFSKSIKITKGIVSSTKGYGDNKGQFQIDAAVQPGNSGGPIYDRYGNIVGVVVAQLNKLKLAKTIGSLPENVNFGIKASTVKNFLNESGIISNWSNKKNIMSNEDIFDIAKKQSVMVVCHN